MQSRTGPYQKCGTTATKNEWQCAAIGRCGSACAGVDAPDRCLTTIIAVVVIVVFLRKERSLVLSRVRSFSGEADEDEAERK